MREKLPCLPFLLWMLFQELLSHRWDSNLPVHLCLMMKEKWETCKCRWKLIEENAEFRIQNWDWELKPCDSSIDRASSGSGLALLAFLWLQVPPWIARPSFALLRNGSFKPNRGRRWWTRRCWRPLHWGLNLNLNTLLPQKNKSEKKNSNGCWWVNEKKGLWMCFLPSFSLFPSLVDSMMACSYM